jgi:hypothetical protein
MYITLSSANSLTDACYLTSDDTTQLLFFIMHNAMKYAQASQFIIQVPAVIADLERG